MTFLGEGVKRSSYRSLDHIMCGIVWPNLVAILVGSNFSQVGLCI